MWMRVSWMRRVIRSLPRRYSSHRNSESCSSSSRPSTSLPCMFPTYLNSGSTGESNRECHHQSGLGEGEEPIPTAGSPGKRKGPPINGVKWPLPFENANLSKGEWLGSHMGSPLFCHSIPGSSSGSPPGCCSPLERARRCICRWFGLRLGRGSTEGPGSTGRIAAALNPGVPGPPSIAVGGSERTGPFSHLCPSQFALSVSHQHGTFLALHALRSFSVLCRIKSIPGLGQAMLFHWKDTVASGCCLSAQLPCWWEASAVSPLPPASKEKV